MLFQRLFFFTDAVGRNAFLLFYTFYLNQKFVNTMEHAVIHDCVRASLNQSADIPQLVDDKPVAICHWTDLSHVDCQKLVLAHHFRSFNPLVRGPIVGRYCMKNI